MTHSEICHNLLQIAMKKIILLSMVALLTLSVNSQRKYYYIAEWNEELRLNLKLIYETLAGELEVKFLAPFCF